MILTGVNDAKIADILNAPETHVYEAPPEDLPKGTMHVAIHREMFSDWFVLRLPNGYTEEVHYEDIRKWFRDHGANMDACEKALDHAWNFQYADFYITHPQFPVADRNRQTPKL